MYISFDLISQRMSVISFLALQSIKQKDVYHLACEDETAALIEEGYAERCKNGSIKLTSKGSSFLESVSNMEITPEVEELTDKLMALYISRGKKVGRRLEVASRLAWFVSTSLFKDKLIEDAVSEYLTTSGEYTSSLENLIWKPQNVMTVHKSLKDSRLYDIIATKYKLNSTKLEETNKSREMRWMTAIAKLPEPPKNLCVDYTFTGSASKDIEVIRRIKKHLLEKLRT